MALITLISDTIADLIINELGALGGAPVEMCHLRAEWPLCLRVFARKQPETNK